MYPKGKTCVTENLELAISSLEAFLEPKKKSLGDLQGNSQEPLGEALVKDLRVAQIANGMQDNKVLKEVLDVPKEKQSLKTLSVEAFQDLYDQIKSLSPRDLSRENKEFLVSFISKKTLELAKDDFYTYVKYIAPNVLPEGFIDGKHIKLMCKQLQKVEKATYNGKPVRQAIYCPPGAMKSKLVNLFISWCLGRHPKWNILHIGHGTQFVEDNAGRPIRDLMRTVEYLRIFPHVEIKSDSRAAGRWELTQGGKYYGAGVNTQIAGRRAHLSICDDVVSEQTAYSIVERRGINAWYVPGLRTRLLPNGSEIIVNTKWHVEDLSGYLENNDAKGKRPWNVIKIPAILDKKAAKLLDLPEGGSFWPEFQPLEFLEERRSDPSMTASKWSALYMQEPVPEEGAIFKEQDFKLWQHKDPPDIEQIILSLDTAYSVKTSSDYSAYSIWGVFKEQRMSPKGQSYWVPNLILIECDKKRWEYPELLKQVCEMKEYYSPDIILVENKASGQSLIPELQLMGFPVLGFEPQKWGDKTMRAHQCTPYLRNGRIWVPESQSFSSLLVKECLEFPFGASDDLVDTLTQTIIHLRSTLNLSTDQHMSEDLDDDDSMYHKKRKTYWSAVAA